MLKMVCKKVKWFNFNRILVNIIFDNFSTDINCKGRHGVDAEPLLGMARCMLSDRAFYTELVEVTQKVSGDVLVKFIGKNALVYINLVRRNVRRVVVVFRLQNGYHFV